MVTSGRNLFLKISLVKYPAQPGTTVCLVAINLQGCDGWVSKPRRHQEGRKGERQGVRVTETRVRTHASVFQPAHVGALSPGYRRSREETVVQEARCIS